jgi:hypothetical protein
VTDAAAAAGEAQPCKLLFVWQQELLLLVGQRVSWFLLLASCTLQLFLFPLFD